jgi:hypothetical protein
MTEPQIATSYDQSDDPQEFGGAIFGSGNSTMNFEFHPYGNSLRNQGTDDSSGPLVMFQSVEMLASSYPLSNPSTQAWTGALRPASPLIQNPASFSSIENPANAFGNDPFDYAFSFEVGSVSGPTPPWSAAKPFPGQGAAALDLMTQLDVHGTRLVNDSPMSAIGTNEIQRKHISHIDGLDGGQLGRKRIQYSPQRDD